MTALEVDGLQLTFDDAWQIVKWDDSPSYREGIEKLKGVLESNPQGTKAMDLVGVREDVPYLLEVKDFRGFAIENKLRQLNELPLEIGIKARDTIAGLVGIVSRDKPDELSHRWVDAVREAGRPIHVVALLVEDEARPGEAAHKRQIRESERLQRIKQSLAWLTSRVLVTDPVRAATIPGLTTRSLAGAGRGRRSTAP